MKKNLHETVGKITLIILGVFVLLGVENFVRMFFTLKKSEVLFQEQQNQHFFHQMRGSLTEGGILLFSFLIFLILLFYKGIKPFYLRVERENIELLKMQGELQKREIERQEALLISLKKQINTHFVVNVLNNIRPLLENNETERAGQMADGLSHLFRYANAAEEYIDGMEELFILQKYLTIMQIRYQGKFQVAIYWDDCLDGIFMPRMLIQPVIENAIVHGFQFMSDGGMLTISSELTEKEIVVRVSDNGCGMRKETRQSLVDCLVQVKKEEEMPRGLEHVALINIAKRISTYGNTSYGVTVESEEGAGTSIILCLPALFS